MEKQKKDIKKPAAKKTVAKPAKVEVPVVEEVKHEERVVAKKNTLNRDFNLLIGVLSFVIMLSLCLSFQGGNKSVNGWEIILQANSYSAVFAFIMTLFAITLVVDFVLAARVDTENLIVNNIEKLLYMFTLAVNVIVVTLMFVIIRNIGLGLILFSILSFISIVIKLARIYYKTK